MTKSETMISANDARTLTEQSSAPITNILAALDEQVKNAAQRGLRHVDCFEPNTFFIVDSYRHVPLEPLMDVLINKLYYDLGYQVSVVRETIRNEVPGPIKDKCFIRLKW